MKHSLKITLLLLGMFFVTQLIGLAVVDFYSPQQTPEGVNYNLPYGFEPPQETTPETSLISIFIALVLAILLMLFFMKFKLQIILKIWFFFVIFIALALALNPITSSLSLPEASLIALILALPLAYVKIFKRNMVVHNLTELLIYPGIAVIFVPWFNILTISAFLVIISLYDIWAVNHTGHMQKMANYQIKTLKIFSGFLVPYLGPRQKKKYSKLSKSQKAKMKDKKIRINLAVLGGGDVVFPIILSGVLLNTFGLLEALIGTLGATLGLLYLFYVGEKQKPYPAMPYITTGCFIALAIIYLLQII